ncbi:MAG: hypothetical protein WC628_03760 [Candidatus Omnitrophota bacterium]
MDKDTRQRLFWFLRPDAALDFSNPAMLETYVQQIITRGQTQDIRRLLKEIPSGRLKELISKIKRFLPAEVCGFWENFFGNN